MKSKWFKLKPRAIEMRKQGHSLPHINKELGIPKSTLSHWLRDIPLTAQQRKRLHQNWKNALVIARGKAADWHREQKTKRLKQAENQALNLLEHIDMTEPNIQELALALLYLGEGTKKNPETGMGSSDPDILHFFIHCLVVLFDVPRSDIRCELHIRADQDPDEMIGFWSKELALPAKNFYKPHLDKRTKGKKTFDSYKGICLVRCGRVDIQRKLVYIAKHFCKQISAQDTRD